MLSGHGISVRYGGLQALNEVDIAVPERAIVGLIGPNGAGKTTLLGALSGVVHPQRGIVLLNGVDVTSMPVHQRSRHGLARTFQQPELFAGLSVRQHLVLAWRIRFAPGRMWRDLLDGRGWRRPSIQEDARVDDVLDRLGMGPLRQAPVAGLPLGLSRLVEVGRALVASPRVVLLDEPFSGLDERESHALATTLDALVTSEGVSFLLVDHDVDTVLARSVHVVVLDFGQMIACGTPENVRTDEIVKAAYLGDDIGRPAQGHNA